MCRSQYDDRQWSPPPTRAHDIPDNSYLASPQQAGNGVFVLLLINLLVFVADKVLHLPIIQSLYLYHAAPQFYQVRCCTFNNRSTVSTGTTRAQFLTCCFCHSSWEHLSTNMFMLLVFGRYVEEEGGVLGLWLTYIICGLGAHPVWFLQCPSG